MRAATLAAYLAWTSSQMRERGGQASRLPRLQWQGVIVLLGWFVWPHGDGVRVRPDRTRHSQSDESVRSDAGQRGTAVRDYSQSLVADAKAQARLGATGTSEHNLAIGASAER